MINKNLCTPKLFEIYLVLANMFIFNYVYIVIKNKRNLHTPVQVHHLFPIAEAYELHQMDQSAAPTCTIQQNLHMLTDYLLYENYLKFYIKEYLLNKSFFPNI